MNEIIICPHCKTEAPRAGTYRACKSCRDKNHREYMVKLRERERQQLRENRTHADMAAMKGFSQLSQEYLTRRL